MEFVNNNIEVIMLTTILLLIIFISLFIVMVVRFSKIKRNYLNMMTGTGVANLEEVIIQIQQELKQLKQNHSDHREWILDLQATAKKMKSNIGFLRYNAFGQHGNDLSFSIAIVDEELNGIVLTGLHSRDDTYIYAKPLEQASSKYALSPEEKEAINLAVKKH